MIDGYSAIEFTAETDRQSIQVAGLHGGPPALSNRHRLTERALTIRQASTRFFNSFKVQSAIKLSQMKRRDFLQTTAAGCVVTMPPRLSA